MSKIVAVSGYFNPIHSGHIDYLNSAKELGDELVVIVNNDKQVQLKGTVPFMSALERKVILENLRCVDKVVISIDNDRTVCKTLEELKPDIFANGGDRSKNNVPEKEICDKYNISMVYGVGGGKEQSSSTLLKSVLEYKSICRRPWGNYCILLDEPKSKVKKIVVKPEGVLSLQSHEMRNEYWVITHGMGRVTLDEDVRMVSYNDIVYIPKNSKHRIENPSSNEFLTFVEIQTGEYFGEDDIKRYEDIYNRI